MQQPAEKKDRPKTRRKTGRPFRIRVVQPPPEPEIVLDLQKREEMLNGYRKGYGDSHIAKWLGVSRHTLLRLRERDELLAGEIDDARVYRKEDLEWKAQQQADKGNIVAIIWLQKNLDPINWRDRHEYEWIAGQGTSEKTEFIASLDDDQAAPITSKVIPLSAGRRQKPQA